MTPSNIGWTDMVHNAGGGCARVSPGCEYCWAETLSPRLAAMGQKKHVGLTVVGADGSPRWSRDSVDWPDQLAAPLKVKAPKRIFWFSMSDLFYERRSFEYIAACFGVMAASPWHTHQVLTKRPARALEFFRWVEKESREVNAGRGMTPELFCLAHAQRQGLGAVDTMYVQRRGWPIPSVHLGVTVEDQQRAVERIPLLLQCPAAVRWVSFEPLLGPVDVLSVDEDGQYGPGFILKSVKQLVDYGTGVEYVVDAQVGIDWAVVGGETGEGRRERPVAEIEGLVEKLVAADVPVFVKQDAGKYPGRQGRISDATWALKQFPEAAR